MRRSTKRGLGLFGKKTREAKHDEYIDFDEQYDDEYEDYDEDYDEEYDEDEPEDDYDEEEFDEDELKDVEEDYRGEEKDDYPEDEDEDIEDSDEDYRDDEDYESEDGLDREYDDADYHEDDIDEDEDEDSYPDDEEDYPDDEDEYPEDDEYDYPEDDYDREYEDDEDYDYDDREVVAASKRRGGHGKKYRGNRGEGVGVAIAAFFSKVGDFIGNTTAVERIAAFIFILLLAGGIATGVFYKTATNKNNEISSFAEVGQSMGDVEVVGESGLLAVADAEKAKAMTAEVLLEEEEEEVADDAEGVTIKMTLTTIKSDIKVKFINSETNKLVANVHFEISVVTPDGTTVTYDDHDMDGIIYKKDITAGTYKVTPKTLADEYSNYTLDTSTKSITVKDTVEMKAVDVSNEVKKESQVNAAVEDTQVKTEVESQLTDTVEWVESTKTAVGESTDGSYSYEQVDKSTITDPLTTGKIELGTFKKLALLTTDVSSIDSSSTDTGSTGTSAEGETPKTDESGSGSGAEKKDMSGVSSSLTVKVGESATISISDPSSPSYKSSDESVATVSSSGSVTGVKAGTATITLSADGYNDANVSVTVEAVEEQNSKFTISNSAISVKVGESALIGASASSAITYTPADSSIVSVDSSGNVKGLKAGSTTIKLTADGYDEATVSVTVTEADKKTIKLDQTVVSLKVGATATVKATDPTTVTWASSDTKIATVKDGTITAVAAGTATITASANNYNNATVAVTVTAADVGKVPMSITKITIVEGQTYKLSSSDSSVSIKLSSGNTSVATVSDTTITAKAAGTSKITVSATGYQDTTVEVTVVSKGTTLKDKNGNVVYVKKSDGSYAEATYNDYYNGSTFYIRKAATTYKYTGWQTIDGKTYFFDKNGNYVTGDQVIMGAKYSFGSDGALTSSSQTMGIDVSKWNGNIDWSAVKNSGVNFVIIRCGYRGSSAGALIEDPKFKSNISGAQAAGLKVGVYFFTQAVNEVEAVEEASMVISLIKGYNISYPVYLDVEASNGRGDAISASQRTANIKAFCGTIANAGYRAGVYANKTWFTSYINTASLTNYRIWLAQYAANVTYSATRYDMWQYTSKGKVSGISGNVDMNICY